MSKLKSLIVIGAILLTFLVIGIALCAMATSARTITVRCIDCNPQRAISLSATASAGFRPSYKGFGSIGFTHKVIPLAEFNVDGIKLLWIGDQLERRDHPIPGLSIYWTFPEGRAAIEKSEEVVDNIRLLRVLVEQMEE